MVFLFFFLILALLIVFIIVLVKKIKKGPSVKHKKTTLKEKLKVYVDKDFINQIAREEEEQKKRAKEFVLLKKAGDRLTNVRLLENYQKNLSIKLLRGGMKIKASEFIIINAITTIIFGSLAAILIQKFLWILIFFALGFFIPKMYVNMRIKKRTKKINDQLLDALSLMSNSLKAGYGFIQALDLVAKESLPPLAEEFERTMRENKLGVPIEDALNNLGERVESEDLSLCITAVLIQRQIGGNLAEILDSIAFTIRERIKIKGQIKALTAQGKMGGIVITLLPAGLGLVFTLLQPDLMKPFFSHTVGRIMIGIALFMQILGAFIIKKVVDIEV